MPSYLPTLNWPIYSGWTAFTPTIPKFYWDVYSQEQRIKLLCCNYSKAEQYLDMVAKLTNDWVGNYTDEVQAKLDELESLLESGIESGVDKWIAENMEYIFTHVAKSVYFGLNLEGYFVAYIPESWEDIIFDTGMNYGEDTYGRLILRWDVDNSGEEVNQRPEIWNAAEITDEELEARMRRIIASFGLTNISSDV